MIASLEQSPTVNGKPVSASVPISIMAQVKGSTLRNAAHVAHVLLVMQRMDHGARAQEQQRLEEGVGEEVEDAGADRRRRRRRRTCSRAASRSNRR